VSVLIQSGDVASFSQILNTYEKMPLSQAKFNLTGSFAEFLGDIHEDVMFKKGVDAIINFKKSIPAQYGVGPVIDNMLKGVIGKKETAKKEGTDAVLMDGQIEYIKSNISAE